MNQSSSPEVAYILTPPCTREVFHKHLLDLTFMQLQMLSFVTSDEVAMRVMPRPVERGTVFFFPDMGVEEWQLRYDDFRQSNFCRAMDSMFDFAYAGRIDISFEFMGDETTFMWAAALVRDLSKSAVVGCWDAFGTQYAPAARDCMKVVETACARAVLEGIESFDISMGRGELSVRQLALLAGMEEMSIRSAANPKKPNALKVVSGPGGTHIEVEVAKAWLTAKGRYVQPIEFWGSDEIDLTRKSFRSVEEVLFAIDERFTARCTRLDDAGRVGLINELKAFGLPLIERGIGDASLLLEPQYLRETQAMKHLAVALDFPPDLFVLRIREAMANEDLQRVLTDIQTAVDNVRRQG